ncbi:hypothetical protein L6164_012772 [Bauhinia variegata]|uniref:Uncharacterized protein n=1 Tax=Bauhinia variegata TaxID=167791 RepID=A0ACB9PA47_BAUVA|nr:hypothetical protein L6164_012772 [Bauhinia variegata]
MAPKRSRKLAGSLNEGEKAVQCTQQQLEFSAYSSRNKKRRSVVAAGNENPAMENPTKGLTVAGQELGQPEKQTGKSILEWRLPSISPVEMRIQNRVGNFLEACNLCKKELRGKDVFMYG